MHVHARGHVHVHVHMYMYMSMYMSMYMCMYMHTMSMYMSMYMHMYLLHWVARVGMRKCTSTLIPEGQAKASALLALAQQAMELLGRLRALRGGHGTAIGCGWTGIGSGLGLAFTGHHLRLV